MAARNTRRIHRVVVLLDVSDHSSSDDHRPRGSLATWRWGGNLTGQHLGCHILSLRDRGNSQTREDPGLFHGKAFSDGKLQCLSCPCLSQPSHYAGTVHVHSNLRRGGVHNNVVERYAAIAAPLTTNVRR